MTRNPPTLNILLGHTGWMRALARSLLFDEHLAEDVVQESLLAALRRAPRNEGALPAYLRSIVRNLSLQRQRTERRLKRRERRSAQTEFVASVIAETLSLEETRDSVGAALRQLEERYRAVIFLRFYAGLSSEQIAEKLKIPSPTVRTRLRRGMDRLRQRLDRIDAVPRLLG